MTPFHKAMTGTLAALLFTLAPGLTRGETRLFAPDQPVPQSQPFTITIESHGNASGLPDLSMLERDFQIVNRRASQRSSTVNGFRSQRTTLSITLLPKRSGILEIPPIPFGTESTDPKRIEVLGDESDDPGSSTAPPTPPPAAPWSPSPQGMQSWMYPSGSDPFQQLPQAQQWVLGGKQEPPAPAETWIPPTGRSPGYDPDSWPQASTTPATPGSHRAEPPPAPMNGEQIARKSAVEDCSEGYPAWLVGLILAGWMATTVFCFQRRRQQRAAGAAQAPAPTPAPAPAVATKATVVSATPNETEEDKVLTRIREAYQQDNAAAARDALLAWGEIAWPGNGPANLTQLAARTSGDLREAILKLDSALYSPSPVRWNDLSIIDRLRQEGVPGSD